MAYPFQKCFDTNFITGENKNSIENTTPGYLNFSDKAFLEGSLKKNANFLHLIRSNTPETLANYPVFDEGINFFSRFENGNLKKAVRVSKTEYELYLSEDYNTAGHYHWFYFKTTSHLPANSIVCFKILNMIKPSSLYSVGFKPFAYSVKKNTGWIPAGNSISYESNNIEENFRQFYTLTWKYTYEFDDDEVYFAQFIPYTYSDLLKNLKEIKENDK